MCSKKAWFKAPSLAPFRRGAGPDFPKQGAFENGFTRWQEAGTVASVNRLDGDMLPQEEMAVLLQPGERAVFDMLVPHSPVSQERAARLRQLDFDEHLGACHAFWQAKLDASAKISVPEKHIDESIKAGLLHCDLVTLGKEPDGAALATIGWYAPIGTESAPIIQFYDSMGWHKLAERAIQFFFERQLESGFIQNFACYESETGPLLWTVGEHVRYTQDLEWLRRVMPSIRKAVNYLLEWRERNKRDELREQGCFASRSCLTGPLWLTISEVLEPHEIGTDFLLKTNQYPVSLENAALSQPYYCRHDFAHIQRREVKPFLKTYYNQLTGLQDQETYTFWEHYYHVSEHKTHEEGWFLMQTRWMLWFEQGDTLSLLRAIPRRWLKDGQTIVLDGVKSTFGAISLDVKSDVGRERITATFHCDANTAPGRLEIRLPHPDGKKPTACSGGSYDPATESVLANMKAGRAEVELRFQCMLSPKHRECLP